MSQGEQDSADKSFEATPQKLQKAREKGEVARSMDLAVAASYLGVLLAMLVFGVESIQSFGTTMMMYLDQPDLLADAVFKGSPQVLLGATFLQTGTALLPWFVLPALAVVLATIAQRAFVFAPSKLEPKLSRISLIANAKNKFGRNGLFEFAKSFAKLLLYSGCLAGFLYVHMPTMIALPNTHAAGAVSMLGRMCVDFMFLVLIIATCIGGVDAVWQHFEHLRKNMMTRKEVMDEHKESDGDPHMKQSRRQKGQEIAMGQMMAEVPGADVVIVNPTHYAVALKWSRLPGSAPTCVAKGVDEMAHAIRASATEAGVPIHSDPPTARALHASVEIGHEVSEDHYGAVAAAIRFAEEMRIKARGRGV